MGWAKRKGTKWRACWRDATGKETSQGGFPSKAEAEVYAGQEEERVRAGHISANRTMTWDEWAPKWLAQRGTEESTEKTTGYQREKWVRPFWCDTRLIDITTMDVRAWLKTMQRDPGKRRKGEAPADYPGNASAHVVAKAYRELSNSLKVAVEARVLPASPCIGIKVPVPDPGNTRAFSEDEVWQIINLIPEPYRFAVVFMAFTGMRFGEVAGLHWANVHEDKREILVADTWDRHGRMIKSLPKDKETRWIPIPDQVFKVLDDLGRPDTWRQPCGLVHKAGDGRCKGQLVIPAPRGVALDSHNMRDRHWLPALRALGLEHGRQHDLRHTYITWLIMKGLTADTVARLVGHSSTYITAKYTHLLNRDHMDRARDVLNGILPPAPELPDTD